MLDVIFDINYVDVKIRLALNERKIRFEYLKLIWNENKKENVNWRWFNSIDSKIISE